MALKIVFARRADNDVDEIVSYISRDNPSAATKVYLRIEKAIRLLTERPYAGPVAPETGQADIRKISVRPYVVFYRVSELDLEIARILHGAREFDDTFFADGNQS